MSVIGGHGASTFIWPIWFQIFSLVPLDREALEEKMDFGAILTSTTATPELWSVN